MNQPSTTTPNLVDLDTLGEQLVTRLRGTWSRKRGHGLCLCPAHADHSPSLSVRVGEKTLLFHCFAGCDALDVTRALLRLAPGVLDQGVSIGRHDGPKSSLWLSRRVQELWESAHPIWHTPAASYLIKRTITTPNRMLRYHPKTPLGPKGAVVFRPAMLAAVHDGSELVAIQRTFLDAERARRARDLGNPRRMLGRPGRGSVKLAPATDTLGLAEGVESAFSAMLLLGFPVWATLGNERFPHVAIPLSVRRLVLLADNDHAGRLAVAAAHEAHAMNGRTIETPWPWHGLNDWNDVLRDEGERGAVRRRQVA